MKGKPKAVVIGASMGGLDALSEILADLPADFPLPIMVVIHIAATRDSLLPELLQRKYKLRVCEVEDKQKIVPGTVYLAAPDYHLLVEKDGFLSLSSEEPVLFSRPSIDVLFETAADAYANGLVGVVLTGANSDGAQGLRKIHESGGCCIIQHPASAEAEEMPLAALQACPSAELLMLGQMGNYLKMLGERK